MESLALAWKEIIGIIELEHIYLDRIDKDCFQILDGCVCEKFNDRVLTTHYKYCFLNRKMTLRSALVYLEKIFLIWDLIKFDGDRVKAAECLGLDYSTLFRKMQKYNISRNNSHL